MKTKSLFDFLYILYILRELPIIREQFVMLEIHQVLTLGLSKKSGWVKPFNKIPTNPS